MSKAVNDTGDTRSEAFCENYKPTPVDTFGVWLSSRQLRRWVPIFNEKRVGDFGCGYHAAFSRTILKDVARLTLVDVSLADDLKSNPKITALEEPLEGALAKIDAGSLDVVICNSVLEHIWEPLPVIREFHRILAPGGVCLLNVPSWRGKLYLELAAFRMNLAPAVEMNDHKMYYDVKDFWPLVVRGGFLPSDIKCFTHKFGLNTFAVATKAR